jgi:hypothetical protein
MTAFGIYAVRTSASCGVGHGFRLGTVMAKDLGKPVRILNDASIQGPDFNTATCQSRLSALIDHSIRTAGTSNSDSSKNNHYSVKGGTNEPRPFRQHRFYQFLH